MRVRIDTTERVTITESPICVADCAVDTDGGQGAVATFSGVVRNHNRGREVIGMYYQCHRELAVAETVRLVREIEAEFPVTVAGVAHRIGELVPGDLAMIVTVSSSHRAEAFRALECFVDRFKDRVPIWKKERYADGPARWL